MHKILTILLLSCVFAGQPLLFAESGSTSYGFFHGWRYDGEIDVDNHLQSKTASPQIGNRNLASISSLNMMPLFFVFFVIIMLCTIFLFWGRSDFPSLHETFIYGGSLVAILLLACVINGLSLFWISSNALRYGQLFSSMYYIIPITVLLLLILFYRPFYRLLVKRNLRNIKKNCKGVDQKITVTVNDLINDMGIKGSVSIISSCNPNTSPYVIGHSPKDCHLVLPSNYDQILTDASDNNSILKEALNRLVLSHELAHIKNSDILLLPIHWIVTKVYKWLCLISAVLYFFVTNFTDNSIVGLFIENIILLNIATLFFLHIFLNSILNKREQLADATASLYTSPDMIQSLTVETHGTLPPLEKVLFSFAVKSPLNRMCLGFRLNNNSWLTKIMHQKKEASFFRLAYINRANAIVSKVFAIKDMLLTSREIFFAAMIIAILFSMFRFVKTGLFTDHMLFFDSPENFRYDTYVNTFAKWDTKAWAVISIFVKIILSFIAANFVAMYYRNDIISYKQMRKPEKIKALMLHISLYLVFIKIMTSVLSLLTPLPSHMHFRFAAIETKPPGFLILISTLFFSHLILHFKREKTYLQKTKTRLFCLFPISTDLEDNKTIIRFLCFIVLSSFYVVFCDPLPFPGNISLLASVNCVAILLEKSFFRLISRHEYIKSESLRYKRLFWKKEICIMPTFEKHQDRIGHLKEMLLHISLSWIVPFSFFCVLGHASIMRFESWYLSNIEILKEAKEAFFAGTSITPGCLNFVKAITYYFLGNYVGPDKIPPSVFVSVLILIIVLIVYILIIAGIIAFNGNKSKFMTKIKMLERLGSILKCHELISPKDKKYYRKHILSKKTIKRPYIYGTERVPLMASTCNGITFMNRNKVDRKKMQDMIFWVKQCMTSDGGFGAKPGACPDIYHTDAALQMLNSLGGLNNSLKILNYKWLIKQLHEFLYTDDEFISPEDWLFVAKTFVDAMSVSVIEELPLKETNELAQKAFYMWDCSKQSVICTSLFATIIKKLNCCSNKYNIIVFSWLEKNEKKLSTISPKVGLADLVEYINIISLLYPKEFGQRDSVIQAKDNLLKVYGNKLLNEEVNEKQ